MQSGDREKKPIKAIVVGWHKTYWPRPSETNGDVTDARTLCAECYTRMGDVRKRVFAVAGRSGWRAVLSVIRLHGVAAFIQNGGVSASRTTRRGTVRRYKQNGNNIMIINSPRDCSPRTKRPNKKKKNRRMQTSFCMLTIRAFPHARILCVYPVNGARVPAYRRACARPISYK